MLIPYVRHYLRQLTGDEKGATAVEYTVLLALILVVIVALVADVGGLLKTAWTTIKTELTP